jgi:hypothetical protein
MPDDPELLHIDGKTFDTDDLTYGERREIRRLIRNELWDEDADGVFDWDEVTPDDVVAVTILVLMRRDDPGYTLAQALACKPEQVMKAPPTKASPKRSSAQKKASAAAGSPS